jgi:hypothetical protein
MNESVHTRTHWAAFVALWIAVLVLLQLPAFGQTVTSSLSGTVVDTTGATIPGATVVLLNEKTKVQNTATANSAGFFSFTALMPSTYTLTVTSKGMATWEETGIMLNAQESRTLPNIALHVAATKTEVTVVSAAISPVPVDSGQSETTLNNRMVTDMAIQGRDALELIRLMPGMAMATGLSQYQWNSYLTQENTGPAGAFSANGTQPNGGMQLSMNGSIILDAGNQGTQIANVNQDMTQEVSLQNSAFEAKYAHGPVVFQTTGKSGSSSFHGGAYVYARSGSLNSNDSYFNARAVTKPIDHYWYPGGNIGGPVIIPGTNFNKNRDKVFFFFGFEYMKQEPVGFLHDWVVPTAQELTGNFSDVAQFQNWPGNDTPGGSCYGPDEVSKYTISGGVIPAQCIDANGLALMKMLAAPRVGQFVSPAKTGGYNFQFLDQSPVNRHEWNVRADYNITQKERAFFSYTRQPETDINNIGVWWWPNGSIPYPSQLPASQLNKDFSFGLTSTFSPTLTNEATFGYAYFINPLAVANPSAIDPSKVGYSAPTYYPQLKPSIPDIFSWCCSDGGGNINSVASVSGFFGPAFGSNWNSAGDFGKYSYTPDFSDNMTWVKGPHTFGLGAFWARYANVQTEGFSSGQNQGSIEIDPWFGNSTGNALADLLVGQVGNFGQTQGIVVDNLKYNELAFYAQDKWRATRRMTITYGMRFNHEGQWYPANTNLQGLTVWDPSTYSATANGLPGLTWNKINSSVPISGWKTRPLFYNPSVGVAYDLFGNGKTVLRGGFAVHQYQVAYNDVTEEGMFDLPLGTVSFTSSCAFKKLADIGSSTCAPVIGVVTPGDRLGGTYAGLKMGDDRTPYVEDWNVSIDRRVIWNSIVEIQYSGNRGRDYLLSGQAGFNNISKINPGGLLKPDPVTGITYYCTGTPSATCNAYAPSSSAILDYRPYTYGTLGVYTHGSYSNYNALVLQWIKQAGRGIFNVNYTYSHNLGIRDANSDNGPSAGAVMDPFNVNNNYGTLAFDRRHIFNAGYTVNLPSPIHHQRFLGGVLNGWQVAGITQFQSGVPLQPNTGGELNVGYPSYPYHANGGQTQGLGDYILGTPDQTLSPYLTCNPGKNLAKGQYFNPNCFTLPTTQGQDGPIIWPDTFGPGYFDTDLGVYKNFKITERHTLQFRMTAFNFINHPNKEFGEAADVNLSFADSSGNPMSTNQQKATTGFPTFTNGRRVVEFAIKYTF